ncbi:MAG: Endonuclease MutS2 [Holosporales bacterium]
MSESDDFKLWQKVLENVKPLKNNKVQKQEKISRQDIFNGIRERRSNERPIFLSSQSLVVVKESKKYFEKKHIEARIDLHGCTCEKASHVLENFFYKAQLQNKKIALVITGKGRPKEPDFNLKEVPFGILRTYVSQWLEGHPQYVVSFRAAEQKDGGDGAFYVHIRRL